MTATKWTPERRAAQAKRMSKYWASPAGRRQRARLSEQWHEAYEERWRAFAAEYPERAALIERTRAAITAGELNPPPCAGGCGRPSKPTFDYDKLEMTGWKKCRSCWRRDESVTSRDDTNPPLGEGSDGPLQDVTT